MRILRKTLRALGFLVLILLLLIIAAILALRFYIAPKLDQWRPELQSWVNKEIHPGLRFDKFKINWQGVEPELVLHGVKILNQEEQVEGSIERVLVQMDWWQLLSGRPKVHELHLQQAQLTIYRDQEGYVRLADEAILYNPYETKERLILPVNRDLQAREQKLKQQLQQIFDYLPDNVHLRQSQIVWRDEQRQSPELVLDNIELKLKQSLSGLELSASILPPENLAGPLSIKADLDYLGSGKAEIQFGDFYPQALRHWLDLPVLISQGYMDEAKLNLAYHQGEIEQFALSSQWRDFVIHEEHGDQALDIRADALSVDVSSKAGISLPFELSVAASNLAIVAEEFFRHPIHLFGVQAKGNYSQTSDALPRIELDLLRARLPSGALQAKGAWQVDPNSDNGLIDVDAKIDFLDVADLPRLLPKAIAADSLDWLEAAFVAGHIENAELKIKGVVDHIPYGRRPNSGEFLVRGSVKNVLLNYHQHDDRGGKRWPKLFAEDAYIDFHNDIIQVTAEQAQLDGVDGLELKAVKAHIANIEQGTLASVDANLAATGEVFKNFYTISPLQRILKGALDQSLITGQLHGDLGLFIPIADVDATTLNGTIQLNQASFQLEPIYPIVTQAQGTLTVSEKNLKVEKLQGQLLGGPVTLQGIIGGAGDSLQFSGQVNAQGLREFLPLKGLQRVQGTTAYTARLDFLGQERLNFSLSSGLSGLALNFPGALKKAPEQAQALEVRWLDKRPQGKRELQINYGKDRVRAHFERIDNTQRFFHRGVVAVNREPILPNKHLAVLIKGGQWDLVQWEDLVEEFEQTLNTQQARARNTPNRSGGTFPELYQLDLDMDLMDYHILRVDNLHLLGNRIDNRNWSLQLRSKAIQGQLDIRMSENLAELEHLRGTYDHVHWQDHTDSASTEEQATATGSKSGRLKLPTIDIKVKQFSFYGQALGALTVKGINKGKDIWQLDEFSLHNEVGSLFAAGTLQSSKQTTAANIGLNLNALNMGKFLNYFGLSDFMLGGNGFVNGRIQVPDVRNISMQSLQAQWEAQISQGSLLSVKSKAVKALEFISLQSLSRLSQVGEGHHLFGEGLQFDYARGQFALEQQGISVADFRLDGPLVAVVAMGNTHLLSKNVDFQAVAVPKIEMSGAAILSGIIVNPIVGVGAFLTQWLLQEPLSRVLTQYFHVTGTWDQIRLDDVPLPSEEQLKDKNAQRKIDDLYRN